MLYRVEIYNFVLFCRDFPLSVSQESKRGLGYEVFRVSVAFGGK